MQFTSWTEVLSSYSCCDKLLIICKNVWIGVQNSFDQQRMQVILFYRINNVIPRPMKYFWWQETYGSLRSKSKILYPWFSTSTKANIVTFWPFTFHDMVVRLGRTAKLSRHTYIKIFKKRSKKCFYDFVFINKMDITVKKNMYKNMIICYKEDSNKICKNWYTFIYFFFF